MAASEGLELVRATEKAMNRHNPRNNIFYIFSNVNSFSGIPLAVGKIQHIAVPGIPRHGNVTNNIMQ
jgi:hypothetical protein